MFQRLLSSCVVLLFSYSTLFMNQDSAWTGKSPADSPPPRFHHAMAYDAARGQVVLFGGFFASGSFGSFLNDTWVWDGTNWTQKNPVNSPPPRCDHAIAYDAARGQVVLFGGFRFKPLNDTWVWDGADWMQQSPANSPSVRGFSAMACDAARGQVVLFGGVGYSNDLPGLNDTWVWEGINWTQKGPVNSPSGRESLAMAYDATRGQVVLFGGKRDDLLNDTWVWGPSDSGSTGTAAVAEVTAQQVTDATGRVVIDYRLAVVDASAAIVSLAISPDGGASYSILPDTAALSGEIGSGVSAGLHRIVWDSTASLPAGTFNTHFRARVTAVSGLSTGAGDSADFAIDLGSGTVTVEGCVRQGETRTGLPGVTVSMGAASALTAADGSFTLFGVSSPGGMVRATKPGYATYEAPASFPAGATHAVLTDIRLTAVTGTEPIVTSLRSMYEGLLLTGVGMRNEFVATVNWNGGEPASVSFYANDVLIKTITGTLAEYRCPIDIDSAFTPSLSIGGNLVKVVAQNAAGQPSAVISQKVRTLLLAASALSETGNTLFSRCPQVLPLPGALTNQLTLAGPDSPLSLYYSPDDRDIHLAFDFEFPQSPHKQVLTFPVIGKFGFEFGANGSFDYTVRDGDWEAALGVGAEGTQGKRGRRPTIPGFARYPKLKLYLGNKEISGRIEAGARGTATATNGITFKEVFGSAGISAKLELGRFGLQDLLLPGSSTVGSHIPGLEAVLRTTSVIIYVIPGIDGTVTFALEPSFDFKDLQATGAIGLEASYEPDFKIAKVKIYVGGELSATLQIPGELLQQVRLKSYAGVKIETWLFNEEVEWIFLDETYPASSAAPARAYSLAATEHPGLRPIERTWRSAGPERFVGDRPSTSLGLESLGARSNALQAFQELGQNTSVQVAGALEADLPLIENVFPSSDPALAADGNQLMLLYVRDGGGQGNLQFTDIGWGHFDGSAWSTPAAIVADTRAEFAPQVRFDGNGDAIAVWQRVADPAFTTVDFTAMATQMEIVWSRWGHLTGTWSSPQPLTSNTWLDHRPMLCGPMSNGNLIAAWAENQSNLLIGTGATGTTERTQIWWATRSATSQMWSAPGLAIGDLAGETSVSLGGAGTRAVLAWTLDLDGDLAFDSDQELFSAELSGGIWGVPIQRTSDSLPDKDVRVVVSPTGDAYLVWRQAQDVVMDRNFTGTASVVRLDSATAGFVDYALTLGPAGNLMLVWQEMGPDGPDAHFRVYDPASGTWSQDDRLFQDGALERSFAPVWDSLGNLTFAYNKVEVTKTQKTVNLEGGGTLTVDGVPTPGRVDLAVFRRQLSKDLEVQAADFSVEATDFQPHAAVSLGVAVHNAGDLELQNVGVGFYDGDPEAGGTLITKTTIPGWLEGRASTEVTTTFVVPEPPGERILYAVVDPDGLIAEVSETNNRVSQHVGGPDLQVGQLSSVSGSPGVIRVLAQVRNLGTSAVSGATVSLSKAATPADVIASASVPDLDPGRLAQLPLDLALDLVRGDHLFTLQLSGPANDVDPGNNSDTFAVQVIPGQPSFSDVPANHLFYSFIENIAARSITAGCGSGIYCPDQPVTRAQMAVFLEKSTRGLTFSPGPATGVFGDVAPGHWAGGWIEQLATDGITAGCGGGDYCPDAVVTRAQMAVFLLKAKYGATYAPPAQTGVFNDVPMGHWAGPWIERLAAEGITAGCGSTTYCPDNPVTRGQMTVFLTKTFGF